MYKVIEIHNAAATRTIELLNEKTGTKDICFDDSGLVSYDNFEFMEKGKSYNCKIKLFGKYVAEKTLDSVECYVINEKVCIGEKELVEVHINKDTYYVYRSKIPNAFDRNSFFFEFTRKDLIQVNHIVHDDLL